MPNILGQSAAIEDAARRAALVNGFPGGYWKYGLTDHVLLVNLYFPPASFYSKLAASLPKLVCSYPSPQQQIAELLARTIAQEPSKLAVGNGVAELIGALLGSLELNVAVPTPSFNPYELTAGPTRLTRFPLQPPSFELDIDAFAERVLGSPAQAAVVISPNNPTSRAVGRPDLLRLATILAERGRRLIVDESFVEFTPDGRDASLEGEIDRFPNLVIFKSLGKIYGACGLRLGYMLTSDLELVAAVRSRLPVWNVNTLAEYFLNHLLELDAEARRSWALVKADRDQLFELMVTIPGMNVLKPQANFVFCRLPQGWPDGAKLAERLLADHTILIRHNAGKTMQDGVRYLRIATRTPSENERLVTSLQEAAESILKGDRRSASPDVLARARAM